MNEQQVIAEVLSESTTALANAKDEGEVELVLSDIPDKVQKALGPRTDPAAYRVAIWVLGIVAVIVVITYAWWTLTPLTNGKSSLNDLPDALIAIGSAAVGALAGILMPATRSK